MKTFALYPTFSLRLLALLLAGMFALMSTGVLHGDCSDGDDHPEHSEQVIVCKCACHNHLYVPETNITRVSHAVVPTQYIAEPVSAITDIEPHDIFRPPKHLV